MFLIPDRCWVRSSREVTAEPGGGGFGGPVSGLVVIHSRRLWNQMATLPEG